MKTTVNKLKVIIAFFVLLSTSMQAMVIQANVTLNCESGNRAIEQGNCWGFGAQSYTNVAGQVISGSWSLRSNSMSNPAIGSSWVKTPWMKMGSGNITLQTKLENTTGTTKQVIATYIPYSAGAAYGEGTLTTFYTFNFPNTGGGYGMSSAIQSLTIPIPAAIANNTTTAYKIQLSFVGTGGNNRANTDNIVIPGEYWSDPSNGCLPLAFIKDVDKDGVPDDQDAYPNDPTRAYNNYLPSDKKFGTVAFEDNWPSKGDYDLNDIVVNYNINRVTNAANEVVEIIGKFVTRASGANYHNAFGFQLDNFSPEIIQSVTGNKVNNVNLFKYSANGLEASQAYANCIVFDDFYEVMKYPGTGKFINTDKAGTFVPYDTLTVTLKLASKVLISNLTSDEFNFYIVANVLNTGRGHEIHLPDRVPTSLVDQSLFGIKDDKSSGSKYYRTVNNLPWAINVLQGFDYCIEKVSINKGYNYFNNWAESNGASSQDWFDNKVGYRNPQNIY